MKLNNRYSRLSLSLVLIIISIGLVSLGIKIPSLPGVSSPSKPKPRNRAIIQTQIEICKEKIAIADSTAPVTRVFSYLPAVSAQKTDYCSIPASSPSEFSSHQSSRAPPTFS